METMRSQLDGIVQTSEQRRADRILTWQLQSHRVLTILIVLASAVGLLIGYHPKPS